jgi:hypothetical protein
MIDDLWYKNGLIYCLSVGTYLDANGDGAHPAVSSLAGLRTPAPCAPRHRRRAAIRKPSQLQTYWQGLGALLTLRNDTGESPFAGGVLAIWPIGPIRRKSTSCR